MPGLRQRLLLRVYLHGILMLALATGASFVVGTYVLKPAIEVPARPSTTWIAWHLGSLVDHPDVLKAELEDIRRVRVEVSLFEPGGRLIATNAKQPPLPLSPTEVGALLREPTRFSGNSGVVALLAQNQPRAPNQVLRYARVSYPVAELPLAFALVQLAVALLVLAGLSMPLARSVTAPVEHLVQLTRAFGSGDLTVRARSQRRDEIGDLARAFDEMAERLVQLRRSEKELLANVSHELRTPLARIRLALELVRDGDTRRAGNYLTDIEDDLTELERLLDDIMTTTRLDLARGTGGDSQPPLRLQEVPAFDVLEAARLRFSRRFPARRLLCSYAANLPLLRADPSLLRRALDNLLENAVKFSDASDPVELHAETRAGCLSIRVCDQGMGIVSSDLERIFEPFFRADPSRTRSTGGVGLGLTVVRRVVQAHDGSVTVRSTPSQGTCFEIFIPTVAAAAALSDSCVQQC